MEEVVYITGAGFSAVSGMPVMSNFLEKAKDIYLEKPEKYKDFKPVIDYINNLSFIKNYYSSDLHNIEEILSIIEMSESVGGKDKVGFRDFIRKTIEYYTPEYTFVDKFDLNHQNFIGKEFIYRKIGSFALSLTNTNYRVIGVDSSTSEGRKTRYDIQFLANKHAENNYTIITLNYDRLIESVFDYLNDHESLRIKGENFFFREGDGLKLYKLHGSIDSEIIPPTWNKILNDDVKEAWKGAFNALKNAKHIRILGYSLPESDSYIKYLFKAAIAENKFLKTLDIICLDFDGSVEERYKNFITYRRMNFINADLNRYLELFVDNLNLPHISDLEKNNKTKSLSTCEKLHNQFVEESIYESH